MASDEYIPQATLDKLATHFPEGTRHQAIIDLAVPMIGSKVSEAVVFATLRSKFEPDVSDKEIRDVIQWVVRKNPAPSGFGANGTANGHVRYQPSRAPVAKKSPAEHCDWWVSGARLTPDSFSSSSPTPIPEEACDQTILTLSALYSDADLLNVVCQFTRDTAKPNKTNPSGAGKVLTRDRWIEYIKSKGVPQSEAGAWFRINPGSAVGSGAGGAQVDADVTNFRYMLLESDSIPVPMQLALFKRLRLPIAAVVLSGGGSAHAWVRVDCPDANVYRDMAARLTKILEPFGIDKANKNPSRLSRLPGALRIIGASDTGLQRLLWINTTTQGLTDAVLTQLEESLLLPALEERPLLALAHNALNRYDEMRLNRGKLGVPFGIPKLDAISGGMKPGQTIVIAGTTGGGKSTMAMHIIDAALKAGYGVALFSLEMDRDEVFDLLVANRCRVNRNHFNNGEFTDTDVEKIRSGLKAVSNLPLYIDDSALTSADQIRLRILQLKAAAKIGLAVVDYIQFVNPENAKDNREQQVATISHKLRALARESRVPMVILSQLNDEGRLRESRVISHNANIVLLVTIKGDTVDISTVKGRGIPMEEYSMEFVRAYARLAPFGVDANDVPKSNNQPHND